MSVIHQMLRDLEAGRDHGRAPGASTGLTSAGTAGAGLSRRLPRLVIATSLLVLVAAGLLRGPAPIQSGVAPAANVPVAASVPTAVATASPATVSATLPATVSTAVPAKVPRAVAAGAPAAVTPARASATASTRGDDVTVASRSTTPPAIQPHEPARAIPASVAPAALPAAPNAASAAQPAQPSTATATATTSTQTAPAAAAPLPAQGQSRPTAPSERTEPATTATATATVNAADAPRIERRSGAAPAVDGAEAHYRKGVAAYNAGRLEEALRSLRTTLAEQPGHVPARQALVAILVDRAEWASAQAALAEALAADPRQAQFALLSSQIQVRLGDPAAAIRTLAAAANDKAPAELHATLAGLLSQARRDREALAHWIAALGRAPDRGAWWLGFGVSLEADGRAGDAAQAYQRALAAGGLNAEVADFARTRVASLR